MKKITNIMRLSAVVNFLLSVFKIVVGFIGSSYSLIADGIHSFSDLFTDAISIIGNHFSNKPADKEHPYGHGRLEYLTSSLIGIVIIILGLLLIGSSITKTLVVPSKIVIVVSFITIIVKFILSSYLIKKGKKYNNNILISSGKESSADVYSSIVVLISSILIQFSNSVAIFKYTDKIATIIVGIFIIRTGYLIIKENFSILIGEQEVRIEYYDALKDFILKDKNILRIDEMVLIKYGSYFKITIEVSMDEDLTLKEAHRKAHTLEDDICKNFSWARYITIHINPLKNSSKNKKV